jgi:hypothetical protein
MMLSVPRYVDTPDVQRHIGGHLVYDDLTLVVVKQQ